MARRDDILGVTGAETVIGSGVALKGNLVGEGDIVIDGELVGEIKAGGVVTLGVNANVKANILARGVNVAGHLQGDIDAADHVNISESGQVRGNINATTMSIASGAIFIGNSRMRVSEPSEPSDNFSEPIED